MNWDLDDVVNNHCLNQRLLMLISSTAMLQVMYSDGSQPVSLGESLVKAGYAKLVNWGLEMMSTGGFNLREAERSAKQQRSGIWRNYVAPATAGWHLVSCGKPDHQSHVATEAIRLMWQVVSEVHITCNQALHLCRPCHSRLAPSLMGQLRPSVSCGECCQIST